MANGNQQLPPPPLEGSARLWGTIALSAATFMNVLDTSIANVSLPAIAGDLGVSPNQGTWVITSFAVANAIAVPLTGWLTQRFGQVRLFMASVLLFIISSWLCGLAPNYEALETVPENRVYVSPGRADALIRNWVAFSHGKVVSDNHSAPGVEM